MFPSLRDIARSVASWALLFALGVDLLALALEPVFLAQRGAPIAAIVATVLAAFTLSVCFAVVVAVPAAAVHGLVRTLGQQKAPWRFLWPAPLAVVAWLVAWNLAPHKVIHARSVLDGQLILAALFLGALLLAAGIARIGHARLRVALGVGVAVAAILADARLPAVLTSEPRDLLWLCAVFLFAAPFSPLRERVASFPHERVSRWLGVLVVASMPPLFLAPLLSPDWRTYASDAARFVPRIARLGRELVDFDGDGSSAIAWGTDCDDADATKQPPVRERVDGVDHNCNGKVRPATSTPEQRGLAPAAGDPDLAPAAIDRVVLVTIDCFRHDSLAPAITPNLVKLAERGLRFEKLYASGARTGMSLPFVLRGGMELPTVAEVLDRERVTTTALFGYRYLMPDGKVFDGFQEVRRPAAANLRLWAPELTDLALADLRDPARARRHFLWMHYVDAHGPLSLRQLPADARKFPPIAGEADAESAIYLAEMNVIDGQIGRVVAALEAMDPSLGHTVLIVTSDHGEGFGRHGIFEHGVSAYEEIIHAPGVMVAPSLAPEAYPHVASQRDVAATVLGAFGLVAKHPEVETFGRSWLRLRAAPKEPLHEFAVTYETTTPFERWSDAPMGSIVDDHAKLSVSYVDGVVRFYDLDADPGEDHELARARPSVVARYEDELELFRDIDAPPR